MLERRWFRVCVSVGAIVALAIFIAGCMGWPSWNSTGTKIAFGFTAKSPEGASRSGVATYDVGSGHLKELISAPLSRNGTATVFLPQWVSGDRLSVIAYFGKSISLDIFPSDRPGPLVHLLFGKSESGDDYIYEPSAEYRGELYVQRLGDSEEFTVVNMATGTYSTRKFAGSDPVPFLSSVVGDRMMYMRRIHVVESPEERADLEFGAVAFPEFGPRPAFTLEAKDLGKAPVDVSSDVEDVAWDAKGERVALLMKPSYVKPILVRVGERWVALAPEWDLKTYRILNLTWSADGNSLLLGVLSPVNGEKEELDYSVVRMPIEGGASLRTRLCAIHDMELPEGSDEISSLLRLSLSPDGKTLATTTATVSEDKVKGEERGLFLVDVSKPNGAVKFVPISEMRVER